MHGCRHYDLIVVCTVYTLYCYEPSVMHTVCIPEVSMLCIVLVPNDS